RGLSIEFRHQVNDPVWKTIWDVAFSLASGILALVFGVALGNVLRGMTLDASGHFFLGLWTDFGVNPPVGVLDWYTLTVGLLAFTTLTVHGSLWVAYRTEGEVVDRANVAAWGGLAGMVALAAAATILTLRVQPQLLANLRDHPWGYVFPAIATVGFLGIPAFKLVGDDLKAFLSSSVCISGMVSSAAFGIFPYVLPSDTDPALGLTVYNTATAAHSLVIALAWWTPGMLLAIGYTIFTHRKFSGKIAA
ncbi:MAG: cytochrome d ubiquinol oxidase subunit II, partial [Acidobacteria bacterium]|nr:cytochrome d ubiquinol oxidase subunit II [Acidobacteriota bacterium]